LVGWPKSQEGQGAGEEQAKEGAGREAGARGRTQLYFGEDASEDAKRTAQERTVVHVALQ